MLGDFPSPLQMKQICDVVALPNVCRWSPWCFVKSLSQVCGRGAVFSMVVHFVVHWCWSVVVCWWSLVARFSFALSHGHFQKCFFFFSVKDIRSVVSELIKYVFDILHQCILDRLRNRSNMHSRTDLKYLFCTSGTFIIYINPSIYLYH